jgi:hypothetical protein
MAVVVTPIGGEGLSPMAIIGSLLPMVVVKVTGADGEGTSADIVIPGFETIEAVLAFCFDSGNNQTITDADITWSGNTVTIADGSTFDLSAVGATLYLLVIGQVNA